MAGNLSQSVRQSLGKNIFQELGLDNLPREQKVRLLERFLKAVQSAITNRVLAQFSPEQAKEFDRLSEQGDQEAINAFFQRAAPNLDKIVAEEVARFKESIIKDVADISQQVNDKLPKSQGASNNQLS